MLELVPLPLLGLRRCLEEVTAPARATQQHERASTDEHGRQEIAPDEGVSQVAEDEQLEKQTEGSEQPFSDTFVAIFPMRGRNRADTVRCSSYYNRTY